MPRCGKRWRLSRRDPALAQLAWYMYWRIFVAPEHGVPWGAPTLEARLGALAGAFYQLLALEFPARLAEVHRQRNYPAQTTAETIQQILAFDGNHRRGRGRPGIYASQFCWLATYLVDPYVRLGRLEFQLHGYGGGVHVWQRTRDGAVLALAEDGVRVDSRGLCLAPEAPEDEGWRTHYREEPDTVLGHPVDPAGYLLPTPVHLPREEWTPRLRRGDTVIDMHIPAGGGMTWDACVESFRRALDFFPRYHPDRPFTALALTTWFMDPQLADLLPPSANPLRLQRACYMYPTSPAPGGLWFVFLQPTTGPCPAAARHQPASCAGRVSRYRRRLARRRDVHVARRAGSAVGRTLPQRIRRAATVGIDSRKKSQSFHACRKKRQDSGLFFSNKSLSRPYQGHFSYFARHAGGETALWQQHRCRAALSHSCRDRVYYFQPKGVQVHYDRWKEIFAQSRW